MASFQKLDAFIYRNFCSKVKQLHVSNKKSEYERPHIQAKLQTLLPWDDYRRKLGNFSMDSIEENKQVNCFETTRLSSPDYCGMSPTNNLDLSFVKKRFEPFSF